MKTHFYLDIETIPTQCAAVQAYVTENIKPPASLKKAESIQEWFASKRQDAVEEAIRKTALDGGLGQVCCVSIAFNDEPVHSFYEQDWQNAEANILQGVFAFIKTHYMPSHQQPPMFIGHNIAEFDLRFLFQRAVVLGIKPPPSLPINAKAWDSAIFDTMTYWAGSRGMIGLDKLSMILGAQRKGDTESEAIDGSKVWEFVQAGKIDAVAKYCEEDVERVRHIYKKLTFKSSPKFHMPAKLQTYLPTGLSAINSVEQAVCTSS